MSMDRAFGALRSPFDRRDWVATEHLPVAMPEVPASLDVTGMMQPVRDQGSMGTCVGFALASGVMGYHANWQGHARTLSPADLYHAARQLERPPMGAGGCYPRAALKVLRRVGVCDEADRPYSGAAQVQVTEGPNWPGHKNREENRIQAFARVQVGTGTIKEAMVAFGPLLLVVEVDAGDLFAVPNAYTSADRPRVINKGPRPTPALHALCLAGWEERGWIVRNSWGTGWGLGGYAVLPYGWSITEVWGLVPDLLPDGSPGRPPVAWWDVMRGWIEDATTA